ncbi:hypothetical protein [Legionella oakridgensis]|uniref:hypothetical protein n=1 Tax=Legionella oakridgensis TaxID=29423 RepID=UPI0003DE2A03|nr:hypothetical protein [Legionella oakridgensis]ETO93955.1 hypothetical protein LOR_88c24700 [Legionella oakridgensis RV-2-2007]
MPTLSAIKAAVQECLKERTWLASAADGVDEAQATADTAKRIVCQLANRWQREAPKQDSHIQFATFLQNTMAGIADKPDKHKKARISRYRKLQRELQTLSSADSPDEAQMALIRLRMEIILEQGVSGRKSWFEAELTRLIFDRLELLLNKATVPPPAWAIFLFEMPANDIAALISHVYYEMSLQKWRPYDAPQESSIYQWMYEEARIINSLSFSVAEKERLFAIGNSLFDPILLSIATNPRFCRNNGGQWRLLDAETLEGMQATDEDYRTLIATIDGSGPTGIGYIMTALPAEESEVTQTLDIILGAWRARFPMAKFTAEEEDYDKQVVLYLHERWLDNIDRFLEKCIWQALPEEVRKIPKWEGQLEEKEEHLGECPDDVAELPQQISALDEQRNALIVQREQLNTERVEAEEGEDEERLEEIDAQLEDLGEQLTTLEQERDSLTETAESYATLRAEIEELQAQLDAARTLRDELDVEELKAKALEQAQVGIVIAATEHHARWSALLNYNSDELNQVLTEEQLTALVHHATDAFIARGYTRLTEEEPGILSQHLAARRELQNEKRSNAEGNLRTQAMADGELRWLAANEVRDPLVRQLYIDVSASTDGSYFRDILIGACLWAVEMPEEAGVSFALPESIRDFVASQLTEDPFYPDKVKQRLKEFKAGRLELPPEQMVVLASYGLQPIPPMPAPDLSYASASASRFGFLAHGGSGILAAASMDETATYGATSSIGGSGPP